jgi:hypothetical protein
MSKANLAARLCSLVLCLPTLAHADCFKSVSELKADDVRTSWRETTANDGKPIIISIADGGNGLVYSGAKAGTPWLSGNVAVCRVGGATSITLKNTRATSYVPMLARMGLPSTQSAQIVGNQIRLAGGGWSRTFVGQ